MASAKEPSRAQANDFTTPDAFRNVMVNVDVLGGRVEINVALIQKNTILYRAGSVNARATDESEPGWNSPLFMSDLESIGPYKNSGRTLMRGISKKNLILFILEMDNIQKIIPELERMFTSSGNAEQKRQVRQMINEFKEGYLVKSDKSLRTPDSIFPAQRAPPGLAGMFFPDLPSFGYNNRIFAELICRAGYDGWISFPGSGLNQRNIDMAEYRKNGQIKYKHNPYIPEVVICKPIENLIYGPVRAPASASASATALAKGAKKSKSKHATKHATKRRTKRGTKTRRR